ncbi:DUF5979 domain-containing protein [Microbacterium sp. NPDC055903]
MKIGEAAARTWRSSIAAGLAVLLIALGAAVPANAAEGDPEYLTVSKSVSKQEVSPGDSFTYTIAVNCSESSCLDAELHDALPAELAGYRLLNVTMQPGAASVPRDATWTVDGVTGSTAPTTITADTALAVDFTGAVSAPVGTGLQNGQTFTVTLSLQVPDDLLPGTQVIENTATTTATNSAPGADSATITVITPEIIDVEAGKTWDPSTQSFNPGASSRITLTATNASNGPVESVTLQEPATAVDGETALDASNPFTITDLTGLGDVTLPAGADSVQVDLYLQQADGTWAWVPGPPSAVAELPADVDPAEIGGVRLTFTGTAIEQDAVGSFGLDVEQRATERGTDADLSTARHTVDNVVIATASVDGRDPVADTAEADYTVTPVAIAASTSKDISPSRIAAGDSAEARIVGTNTSDTGVAELHVSDLDYFDEDVLFDGFSSAPQWPEGADSGTLVYHPLDGSDPITVVLEDGVVPALPGVLISGFEIVFTADGGGIVAGASTVADFTIRTTEDAIVDGDQRATSNTATTSVVAPNGIDAEDSDSASLVLLTPEIDVVLEKSILPSSSVSPGEPVVTELAANLTTTSDYVTPTRIVVEDGWTGDGGFWDAFELSSIAPTQVPGGTALTIEVQDESGAWRTLQVFPAQSTAHQVSMTTAQIQAALPAGLSIADVRGIRFTFDKADGFASDTTVTPYVVSEARSTLRTGGSVVPGDDQPVSYPNLASTTGTGETGAGTQLTDTDTDTAEGTIETYAAEGSIGIDKRWSEATVSAQSQQVRGTTLSWRVEPGYEQIAITDPATSANAFEGAEPGQVAGTVYDAFDLVRIEPIAASAEPFSNGWYMQYDDVDVVELYIDGVWTAVPAPASGWIDDGRFVGYVLTDAERAGATGFRIVLSADDEAREAAEAAGDPWVTALGEGVGASSAVRTFDLIWQIRDAKRSDGAWVTDEALYNTDDAGVVENAVRIDGKRIDTGTVVSDVDADTILITDPGPGVTVDKRVTPTAPLYVPVAGTAASAYPSATFTLEARNDSVAKASYIRVTDPPVCADADPMAACQSAPTAAGAKGDPFTADIDWLTADGQGNPFERFDLRAVTISAAIADQVDLAESVVWLLRYVDGEYVSEATSAAAVNAMTAAQLADVVGISVTFQGTDPEVTGGTITPANVLKIVLQTQVRTTLRSTGEAQTVAANERVGVANRVFAQSYDPILAADVTTGARDAVAVTLTGGDLNVAPTKSVTPDALTEPTRDTPVTVRLGANQGTNPVSTLATREVRLTDDSTTSPEFWDAFDLTGLGAITAPAGADRVAVSVYGPFGIDGELAWVSSAATPVAGAVLPVEAEQYGDVVGIRFAFSRADGGLFSSAFPAPSWNAAAAFTVQLRDTHRAGGEPVELVGTIENTVMAISDRLNGETSEEKAAAAEIDLGPGTFRLGVNKLANDGDHFAAAGEQIPFDLTFTNTGTGYLTITELRDALPEELVFLGDVQPVYSPDPDGQLTEPASFEIDGDELVFTWADGARMNPGETFGIRIILELQPGLVLGERAVNEMTVHTAETLTACTNTTPGAGTTGAWASDATTCGTTDYVTPADATSLFVVKGVRGSLPGAILPGTPDAICQQNLVVTGGAYFRSPCAANSVIGGVDAWVLRAQNGGTSNIAEMVLFDQLPVAGDSSLISGASRSSVYRPQLLDDLDITAPAGTTIVLEVTSSADVCRGTWSNLANQVPCAQNGEVWSAATADTDWSQVSGIRVSLDFRTTTARALTPGQFVDVTYSSVNVAASADEPGGAPVAVPASDSFAWNQFGVKYRDADSTAYAKIAPSKVGVHLVTGSLSVRKTVDGPAAAFAATSFTVDAVCEIDGVPLDLGDAAALVLDTENAYAARIDGIPVGADCTLTERGDLGSYGEASRTGSPTTVTIAQATAADESVPAAQAAEIVNAYDFAGLTVTKRVETDATGSFGPFDFTLSCISATGIPVLFDGEEALPFTLMDGETFTAPADTIPARATCLVTEVDASGADGTVVVGTGVTDLGEGRAEVEVGTTDAEVSFTNSYDAGILTVAKQVDGEGAALYGAGSFTFSAVCTYRGQTLLDESFALEGGSMRTFGPYPASTSCAVEEIDADGATNTVISPESGIVVLGAGVGEQWTVLATNTFDLTEISVVKERIGDLDAAGADGAFTVELVCVLPTDDAERAIDIPGGAERVLDAANGYTAAYADLPVDARCDITETDAGTAVSTTVSVAQQGDEQTVDGATAAVAPDADGAEVTITNRFAKELPQTGLAGGALLWLAVLLLLGGGAAALVVARRARRAD